MADYLCQELLGRLADVLFVGEPLSRFFRIPHFLEPFHAVLPDFENARRIELEVGRADFARDHDRVPDHLLNEGRFADGALDHVMATRFASNFRQTDLIEEFSDRRHLGDESFLHQTALLATGIGVQFVIEANRGELLLAEPGLQRHVEADIDGGAVAGEHDHVFRPAREADAQGALQAGGDGVLVPEEGVNVVHGHHGEHQAGAAGGTDHDGVFGVRQ